jgi:DNA primase
MLGKTCRNFLTGALTLAFFAGLTFAANHHELNGTWDLVPARSQFNGQPALQTGTVTINDREHNVYVSRDFNFDQGNTTVSTNFSTDARHNASIKEPGFKSKAKWEGDVLKVTTVQNGVTIVERYSLQGDGTMMLQVDRTGLPAETLYFQRP